MKKKGLTAVIALLVLIIAVLAAVMFWLIADRFSAEDKETDSGYCGDEGENLEWTLYESGEIVISGEGAMANYTKESHAPWYKHRAVITSAKVEDGVTHIGDYAFKDCEHLATITIPETVETIGEGAFEDCDDNIEINWKNHDSPLNETTTTATSAPTTTLPSHMEINSGVCGDNAVWTLYDDGELVISGSGEMDNYTYFDSFSNMFTPMTITKVTFDGSVTSVGSFAFHGCSSLEEISLGNVTTINASAFAGCSALKALTIPDSVTYIDEEVFYGCTSITTVQIGRGLEYIGPHNFFYDSPGFSSLKSFSVSSENKEFSNDATGAIFDKEKTALYRYPPSAEGKSYTIPSSVTKIGANAFTDCASLETLIIPESVTEISVNVFGAGIKTIYFEGSREQWNGFIHDDAGLTESITVMFNYSQ